MSHMAHITYTHIHLKAQQEIKLIQHFFFPFFQTEKMKKKKKNKEKRKTSKMSRNNKTRETKTKKKICNKKLLEEATEISSHSMCWAM